MTAPGRNPSGSGSPPPRSTPPPSPPAPRRSGPLVTLIVLILSAAALFAAGMSTLSLPSLDDAMYARKGVEMARSGGGFTVTWAGRPWFENPPLQFWLLALSFRLFGEGDGAARLPSWLMGCATLLLTFLLGRRLLDEKAALAGVALLLLSPIFVTGARGCMMDLPLTFWISSAMLLFVEGMRRPWLHLPIALPLAGGILTKSLLGLLPAAIVAVLCLRPEWRPRRILPLGLGAALGLGLGASWSLEQWLTFGPDALQAHYWRGIGARASAEFDVVSAVLGYPRILLQHYQPVVVPGLLGAVWLLRDRRRTTPGGFLLAVWVLLPIVLYSLSAAQSNRYLYPILPALALCAGHWLRRTLPRVERHLATRVAPAAALAAAVTFAVAPASLTRDLNGPFKRGAQRIQARAPSGRPIPYFGDRYWEMVNPLLYYTERTLGFPPESNPADAVAAALEHPAHLLLCDRDRLAELAAAGRPTRTVAEGARWVLLEFT